MAPTPPPIPQLILKNLKATRVLGQGTLGTVFLITEIKPDPSSTNPNPSMPPCPFALKIVRKSTRLTKFDYERRAQQEMDVLSKLHHPYLPTLLGKLDDDKFIGWALPYYPGGDLRTLMRQGLGGRSPDFTHIKFYVAELVCALEHLHSKGIVYRDLKPENILIQQDGHLALIDFEFTQKLRRVKHKKPTNNMASSRRPNSSRNFISPCIRRRRGIFRDAFSYTFVGAEAYVAPEVILGYGYDFGVDWWSLGVLIYEMVNRKPPFGGSDRREKFFNVVSPSILVSFENGPDALKKLMENLLQKDPQKRLGYSKDAEEIREHEYFQGTDWSKLTPPTVPREYQQGPPEIEIEQDNYIDRMTP